MASSSRAGLGFILVTVFLDFVGVGLIIPVLPDLVGELIGEPAAVASELTPAAEVEAFPPVDASPTTGVARPGVARVFGWLIGVYSLTQFVFAPLVGALADRFGRRPVLLVSIAGLAIDFAVCAVTSSLTLLFIARVVAGATAANVTAVNAYVADVSGPDDRVKNFGFVGATIGLGFILGPGLGGLLGTFGTRVPFYAAAALGGLNFLYGLFVLPESLPKEDRTGVSWSKANPVSSLGLLKRDRVILGLAVCTLLAGLADQSLRSTWVLFTQTKFGWDSLANGLALSTVGVLMAAVQGGLASKVTARIGRRAAVLGGLACSAIAMAAYSFVPSGWMLYPLFAVGALGGLAYPAIQSVVTSRVGKTEQGAVQGALTGLVSLSAVVAPPLATNLFAMTTDGEGVMFAGSALLAGGGLYAVATAVAARCTDCLSEDAGDAA